MGELSVEAVLSRYRAAQSRRRPWESLWQDCYTYALPQRGSGFGSQFDPARRHAERLFDGTATDAVEQLAASLLSQLTPPWSQWFGLVPGHDIGALERTVVAEELDRATETLQGHFDRSNFAVEIHQTFLDLATIGSATLLFEEAPLGVSSAFRLTAVPMSEMHFEAGPDDQILGQFRSRGLPARALRTLFPEAALPEEKNPGEGHCHSLPIVEAVLPEGGKFLYMALLLDKPSRPTCLAKGLLPTSPFISFRWLKGASEVYGRSPVMTALPDIKTANKVVELVLKNASIAVTGIWQADDDGVLNPANIRLVPGTIIPKAVGSSGLTPLQAPGRFDVSNLMLDDLRGRIRHTLLVDRLGPVSGRRMTATEILERSNEMSRLLGATYGRLQSELLTPLINQGMRILRRRGEILDVVLDGRTVTLQYRSPLARAQARDDVQNTLLWLETSAQLGPEAMQAVDVPATARWLAERLGCRASWSAT
ncbi:MAG: phage tail protein [Rhizobiales bacterium]|nr:phage tail protein [Hyphomicrobiales bacterium]